MDCCNYVNSVRATRRLLMIQNFAKELLTRVIFNQVVLIAMQTLFADFNVSRHAKDELL